MSQETCQTIVNAKLSGVKALGQITYIFLLDNFRCFVFEQKHMKQILIVLFVTVTVVGYAQDYQDSVRTLSEIQIIDQRLTEYTTGTKVVEIDESYIKQHAHANLTDILRRNSSINIRSYGLNGLSTISFRGAGSNQSTVLWEGINLQSSTNGSLDLSLIPMSFVDKVTLQHGGGSSLFGSGAIGGTVHLSGSQHELNKPISASLYQQIGSFGSTYTGLNLVHSGKNYSVKIRGFRKNADNDFKFFNEFSQKWESQDNAEISQEGVMLEGYYKVKKHQFVTKYWLQDNLVYLPKTKSQGLGSLAFQKDKFHRGTMQWHMTNGKFDINIKTAYIWHHLIYHDAQLNIESNNLTKSSISEGMLDYNLDRLWKLQIGTNYTIEKAEVDGYRGFMPQRNRLAIFSSLKGLLFDKLETTLSLRESYIDQDWSPFLPSLGIQYQMRRHVSVKAKVSKSYRIPTFNDLYWWQGGNPDLRPERGTSIEMGIEHFLETEKRSIKNEITIFSNYVHDWILWAPVDNYAWSPKNIQEVWSKGIEFESRTGFRLSDKVQMEASVNYQLTDTRVQATFDAKGSTLNQQMILTPLHKANLAINFSTKQINAGIQGSYTGEQYTDDNNSNRGTLEPFLIWDIFMSKEINITNEQVLSLGVDLKNVFDHQYDVRNGYPMPGRNFSVSLKYEFNK